MVLVSHLYKFIYLKNYKVAGSSVESFFGQFCVDPGLKESYSFQDFQEEKISSFGILGSRMGGHVTKWNNHKNANEILNDLGVDVFQHYFKFCVVRNPYDAMVSWYFWEKSTIDFKTFCKNFNYAFYSNLSRIFLDGEPICQYYIRYENLVKDIVSVLEKLGISDYDVNTLPKHKSEFNPRDKSYQNYYDEETREIVRKGFETEIEFFNYKF